MNVLLKTYITAFSLLLSLTGQNNPAYIKNPGTVDSYVNQDVFDYIAPGIVTAPDTSSEKTDFPENFDLRDYGIITPVYDQKDYGTCWAICALESLETQILKNKYEETIDLSEWHLSYFTFSQSDVFHPTSENIFLSGGTNTMAAAILSRWIGAVYEETLPYESTFTPDASLKFQSDYKVQEVYNIHPWTSKHNKYDTDFLKELLYDQNSISVFYNSSKDYYNSSTYSHCCLDPDAGITHAVLLVGWDDNFPAENFKADNRPENDGAWLVKNSWGEDWGDEGYFWLSYEDATMCEGACFFGEPADTCNYDSIYYYDNVGWVNSISADSNQKKTTGYMSNIFKAEKDDNITAVAFYTTQANAEYEVSVYTNVKSTKDPTSGTLVSTASGTEKYVGYHTVELDTPAPVEIGTSFSVVVKIKNPSSPYNIATETSVIYLDDGTGTVSPALVYVPYATEKYKSYISSDGKTWKDTAGSSYTYKYPELVNFSEQLGTVKYITTGNVCIKAFGSDMAQTIKGDINSNGKINVEDLIIMTDIMHGIVPYEDFSIEITDINEDGVLNIIDLMILKEILIS